MVEEDTGDIQLGRRKVRELECMVADVLPETHDTSTLYLFTGNERLLYEPGHFLSIDPHQFKALERWVEFLEDHKGKRESARAYSLASAPHERYLAITVKEERYQRGSTRYPPLLSPLLVRRLAPGTRIVVTGFTGPYTLSSEIAARTDHLLHLCAGSGIVPNFSIIKEALHRGEGPRHTLIYTNKTWGDVIYRRQLDDLARAHPDRLRVVHLITRDPSAAEQGSNVRLGRMSTTLLGELVEDWTNVRVMACGPAATRWDKISAKARGEAPPMRFLESTLKILQELGVPKDRIHKESYG